MKTLVFGVGAFGVAILNYLSKLHPDQEFFAYEKDQHSRNFLRTERKSPYFFSDVVFGQNITFIDDPRDILAEIDLVVLIIPNQFIAGTLKDLETFFKKGVIFLNLSKGINNTTLETVSDVISRTLEKGSYEYACLSGGMIAAELVSGNPLGADIGVSTPVIGKPLHDLFESDTLAINITPNYKNTELYGALKNIFALYIGYLEGKGYGASTIGYYNSLLWQDLKKLVPLLGGHPVLDYGDFALGGDMIATCFGNSRNKYFGKLVGGGISPLDAYAKLKEEKKTAEGYETLKGMKSFIEGKGNFSELEKVIHIFLG